MNKDIQDDYLKNYLTEMQSNVEAFIEKHKMMSLNTSSKFVGRGSEGDGIGFCYFTKTYLIAFHGNEVFRFYIEKSEDWFQSFEWLADNAAENSNSRQEDSSGVRFKTQFVWLVLLFRTLHQTTKHKK